MLLYLCRKQIQQRRMTHLVRATSFLHGEYEPFVFWWELAQLIERLLLGGFMLVLFPEERFAMFRIITALLVAVLFLVVLMFSRPYKNRQLALFSIMTQFSTFCCLLGGLCIKLFVDLEDFLYACPEQDGTLIAVRVTGFDNTLQIILSIILFTVIVLVIFVIGTFVQVAGERSVKRIRLVSTRDYPELSISKKHKWHLFLSHIWSSGQDQVATIKRQLQLLLPGVHIFLDVDDLVEIGDLEGYVDASQTILIFLSKGYFFSKNCLRELEHSTLENKPLVLVQEVDPSKGGASIQAFQEDCPSSQRAAIFYGHKPIVWHRIADYQLISLKMISSEMLLGMPSFEGKDTTELYVPGEITSEPFAFNMRTRVYVSRYNPGAEDVVTKLAKLYTPPKGGAFSYTQNMPPQMAQSLDNEKEMLASISNAKHLTSATSSDEQPKAISVIQFKPPTKLLSWLPGKIRYLAKQEQPMAAQEQELTHMLVYLCASTFDGQMGQELAQEIRFAKAFGLPVTLVHETDPARGGCEFGHFFATTPGDLVSGGLYKTIAISFPSQPHRKVGYALLAKAFGAKPGAARKKMHRTASEIGYLCSASTSQVTQIK
uniref:TIR domain-containing protein n=1 Tax=Coccolithus braarudii TaxID=221442 RepID=A0A7S0L0T4_9EUKA